MMTEKTYAQLLEEKTRYYINVSYSGVYKFSNPNEWMIMQFEALIAAYPELEDVDYFKMTLSQLVDFINEYLEGTDLQYEEQENILFLEADPLKGFFSKNEFMLLSFLLIVGRFKLMYSLIGKKKLETQDCSDFDSFPYLFENSRLIPNSDKHRFHLLTSVKSLIEHIYLMPDHFIKQRTGLEELPNNYGESSIAHHIKEHGLTNELDDEELDLFLEQHPTGIKFSDVTDNGSAKLKI